MTDKNTSKVLQVVSLESDHTFKLHEKELKQVLLNSNIADLPVVVISIAGAYRGGKSFLLNFFLRYLSATPTSRKDGSWLGEGSEKLLGFSWRGGSKRNTTGILIWSEPAIVTLPSGEEVAVILMDTQGTFDNRSSVRDCSTIFAMSTLLSSLQIYNIFTKIQEDDLQQLQLFTDYGKLAKEGDGKPFQILQFLIRDWIWSDEFAFGAEGGQLYLEQQLQITPDQSEELKELRQHIKASFEKVSCFLMPFPGEAVTKKTYQGEIKDLKHDFKEALKELCYRVFSPETLTVKKLNNEIVTCRDLFTFFQTYMKLLNSDEIPSPTTILKATVEANLLTSMNAAESQYKKNMDTECGPKALSVPIAYVRETHKKQVAAARDLFNSKKSLGSKVDKQKYVEELTQTLNGFLDEYIAIMAGKTTKLAQEAQSAYDQYIKELTKGQPLCVHASDLLKVHKEAKNASIAKFDNGRKRIPNVVDEERQKFVQEVDNKWAALRMMNEQNNKVNASDLKMEYWQNMILKCTAKPALSTEQFENEHKKALQRALDAFEERRNLPNTYNDDSYKATLKSEIELSFLQLQQINQSTNRESFQVALMIYHESVTKFSELRKHCLHPNQLRNEHDSAACKALTAFRPSKHCYTTNSFNKSDKDEAILYQIFESHFEAMEDINNRANEVAKDRAYKSFIYKYDDLVGFSWSWLVIVPMIITLSKKRKYFEEAKNEALEEFYGYRRSRGNYGIDIYVDQLETDMYNHAGFSKE